MIGARAREHLQQIARDVNITPRDIAQLSRILGQWERKDLTNDLLVPDFDLFFTLLPDTEASSSQQAESDPLTGDLRPSEGETTVPITSITSACSAPNVRTSQSSGATITTAAVAADTVSQPRHQHRSSEYRAKSQSSQHRTLRRQSSSTKEDPLAASGDEENGEEEDRRSKQKVGLRGSKSLPGSSLASAARVASEERVHEDEEQRRGPLRIPHKHSSSSSIATVHHVGDHPLQPTPHHHHYHHHVCRRASRAESSEDIEYYELNTTSVTPTSGAPTVTATARHDTCTFSSPSVTTTAPAASGKMELVELSDRPDRNITKIAIEHRELPVDVPDSFVGVVKTTPRYPPPAPLSSTRSMTSTSPATTTVTSVTKTTPSSSSDGDRVRKYAEDVRNKKSEEELLRSSLRGSKKLQQLEHQQLKKRKGSADVVDSVSQSTGFPAHSLVNPAFEPDFDNNIPLLPANQVAPVLPDMDALIQRLSSHLTGDVKDVLTADSKVAKFISIYKTVMQEREKRLLIPTTSMPSTDLVQETITMLQRLPLDVSVLISSVAVRSPSSLLRPLSSFPFPIPGMNSASKNRQQRRQVFGVSFSPFMPGEKIPFFQLLSLSKDPFIRFLSRDNKLSQLSCRSNCPLSPFSLRLSILLFPPLFIRSSRLFGMNYSHIRMLVNFFKS